MAILKGRTAMGLRCAIISAVIAAFPGLGAAQQAFPYKAYIVADDTYVRSGPGEQYYPTGKLNAGTRIEVYRHDPGGWYAIRPPQGSFSWIGRRYVREVGDGVAEVTGERVAVRVGTELSDRRDVVQVRVTRGELLELLGQSPLGSRASDPHWIKIAPPSGEFRWVHGSEVDTSPPSNEHVNTAKSPAMAVKSLATTSNSASNPAATPTSAAATASAAVPTSSAETKVAWTPAPSSSPTNHSVGATNTGPSTQAGNPSHVASAPRRTSQEIQKDIDEINAELSLMLAQEPSAWEIEGLGRRARSLLDQVETAVDRGHVRMLVQRIAQAEDVKRRALASAERNAGAIGRGGTLSRKLDEMREWSAADIERFDGVGRLSRVQSARFGAPRYALLDEQGNVKAYVSPAPGVNAKPFLGRHVGVSGPRARLPEQNAEHLTAKQITPLDSRVR